MDNNLIIFALLDDNIEGNILRYIIEELEVPLLNNFRIGRRIIRKKNENYYERIVPLYNGSLFKEHFRMSPATAQV